MSLKAQICSKQVVVVPMRINVNLKAVTTEDLIQRRKVLYCYLNTPTYFVVTDTSHLQSHFLLKPSSFAFKTLYSLTLFISKMLYLFSPNNVKDLHLSAGCVVFNTYYMPQTLHLSMVKNLRSTSISFSLVSMSCFQTLSVLQRGTSL